MNDDREMRKLARDALDDEVAGLDGRTLARLTQARSKALEGAGSEAVSPALWFAAAGAFAVAALAVGLLRGDSPATPPGDLAFEELLLGDEDLEFYGDVELLEWMESERDLG